MMNLLSLAEIGMVPDFLIRFGIRRLLARRLQENSAVNLTEFTEMLRTSPLAIATESANQQHYEVPVSFFKSVLGPRLKYSSSLFPTAGTTLAEAEEAMLRLTCERTEIQDGMSVLELGCGWGSLTLWLAEKYPSCTITALSNSASQRQYIESCATSLGLTNVRVITADICDFETNQRFDRVLSVEMFEHLRNYEVLFCKISDWMTTNAKMLVHVFCHRNAPYLFETGGAANWMGRHFFTGGMMPSEDLFSHFSDQLTIERQWRIDGTNYQRTCEAWLQNLDQHQAEILAHFRDVLPDREARIDLNRWRIFFMACAELFGYRNGQEWFVMHYLFEQAQVPRGKQQSSLSKLTQ